MHIGRSLTYSGVSLSAVTLALLLRPGTIQTGYARPAEAVTIQLTGPLRDFRRDHPDFNVNPSGGRGHYALTVDEWLADTPTRGANGYKVGDQTIDSAGRNIAPSLAGARPALGGGDPLGIRVLGTIKIEDEAVVDAYNSGRGPYGISGNYGRTAYMSTNSDGAGSIEVKKKAVVKADLDVGPFGDPNAAVTGDGIVVGEKDNLDDYYDIPPPSLPAADEMEAVQPKLTVFGTVTLTGDTNPDDDSEPLALHYAEMDLKKDSTLKIVGDLVVVCDGRFKMSEATIEITPEASLTLHVGDDVQLNKSTVSVADATSASMSLLASGNHELKIEDNSQVIASIVAPDRELELKEAHLYGAYLGRDLTLGKKAGIHVDDATADTGDYNFAVTVREKLELKDVTFDGFDSDKGNYGPSNSGIGALLMTNATKKNKVKIEDATLGSDVLVGLGGDPNEVIETKGGGSVTGSTGSMATPATIPVVMAPPAGLTKGKLKMKKQTLTLSGENTYDEIEMDESILRISGDVVLRVDGKFKLEKSHVQLLPNSTLTVYVHKELELKKNSTINAWGNPQRVSIRRSSVKKGKVKVEDDSVLAAWVQGAKTKMEVKDGGVFLGSFAGDEFKAEKSTVIVDMAGLRPCIAIDDTPGSRSVSSTGAISSDASFRQWFIDDPWANVSRPYTITLTRNNSGVYEYIEPKFYPTDGGMFGNDGDPHNYHFTYEIDAYFDYVECGGGFVEFRGGDGCWIFIDGQMAIDLGGVATTENQRIDVDRFGLTEGTHRFQLFYAQRKEGDTPFELRTNLLLDSQDFMPLSLQFD